MTSMANWFSFYHASYGKDKKDSLWVLVLNFWQRMYLSYYSYASLLCDSYPNSTLDPLSVSHITKSLNWSVAFSPFYCLSEDLKARRTIGKGHEDKGLSTFLTAIASSVQLLVPTNSDPVPS